jgi:hypothetical protein
MCCALHWLMQDKRCTMKPTALGSGAWVAIAQGSLYLATGLWPVFHLASFMAVTGPKTDYWLVQSFGVLVAAVGVVFLVRGIKRRVDPATLQFGLATSLALAAIDFWFVMAGAISPIYLADGAVELLIALRWLLLLRQPGLSHSY